MSDESIEEDFKKFMDKPFINELGIDVNKDEHWLAKSFGHFERKAAAEEISVHIEGELRTLERRYDRVPIEVLAFIEDIRDYFKKKFGVE